MDFVLKFLDVGKKGFDGKMVEFTGMRWKIFQ